MSSWNADGLKNKKDEKSIHDFINKSDIVGVQETWSESKEDFIDFIPGFSTISLEGTRQSRHGRCSGGIVVFVRNELIPHVKRINDGCKFAIFLVINKQLTGFDKDTVLMYVYLPPQGSTFYNQFNTANGVELLQEEIMNLSISHDYYYVLCGDLNARCGELKDFIIQDGIDFVNANEVSWYDTDVFEIERQCMDKTHNAFGRSLVDMCIVNNMHMLNGRKGEESGGYTCVMTNGKSIVDYCICSSTLFPNVKDFAIKYEEITTMGMTHFPLITTISCSGYGTDNGYFSNTSVDSQEVQSDAHVYERIKWKMNMEHDFYESLCNNEATHRWSEYDELLKNDDIDQAVSVLETIYKEAAKEMIVHPRKNEVKSNEVPWWDDELLGMKNERNTFLRRFRETREQRYLKEYVRRRKLFKNKYREKEREYRNHEYQRLLDCKDNSKEFWNYIRQIGNKGRSVPSCNISHEQWYNYYKNLLNQDINNDMEFSRQCEEQIVEHDEYCNECAEDNSLNEDISESEVKNVIMHMQKNKAPGYDGLIIELFQITVESVAPRLCKLYNKILTTSEFPERWSLAIICSLYKSGDVNNPSNYRGISLLSICGKIFTKILNNRLVQWANANGQYHEEQAGYREGYSTIDHIFTLYSLAQKYLSKPNGRFYVLFVDFSKAFDRIPHSLLWHRMIKIGVHGQILKVVRSMYSKLKSCVRIDNNNNLTDWFECNTGTRQGCMLSPFIFTMYLNELIENINNGQIQGINVTNDCRDVCLLCYADDMANCADMVPQLQRQLNVLEDYCHKYGMEVNITKTKIIVFRNGGPLRKCEKWYFKGKLVECVSAYKYLGVLVSSRLKWNRATQQLGNQAQKALHKIYMLEKHCNGIPHKVYFDLFDKMITPILLYGSEVWGSQVMEYIESVHRSFCRRRLGVRNSTSNIAVLGECGRFPLYVTYYKRCLSYWIKLLEMSEHRLPKQCYYMSKTLHEAGRQTWAGDVHNLLDRYGFSYVWNQQMVTDKNTFLNAFVQRVKDCYVQHWFEEISNSTVLTVYKQVKQIYEPEKYLTCFKTKKFISSIARLRCATHNLNVDRARHSNTVEDANDMFCKFCIQNGIQEIENEFHFVCTCVHFKEIRLKYLKSELLSERQFRDILMSTRENRLQELALYLYHAFECRKSSLIL